MEVTVKKKKIQHVVTVPCVFPCGFLKCCMFLLPFSPVIKTIPLAKQLAVSPAFLEVEGLNIYMLT